jgi:sulfate adenylyltransferase
MSHLIEPHGGKLIDLMVTPERRDELREQSRELPSWDLTPRQLCDLEILMTGGFSPLEGFMTKQDADAVASGMRLADGTLWPIPITGRWPGIPRVA